MWVVIIVLVVLWALGFFGHRINSGIPNTGGWVHTLIVIALILLVLKLLGVI